PPQAIELQRLVVAAFELTLELAGRKVIRIDRAVAKITDQQRIRERPEVRWRQRDAPRCVQPAAARETAKQISIGVEFIDSAETGTRRFVVLVVFSLCVGHEEVPMDILNVEWRK